MYHSQKQMKRKQEERENKWLNGKVQDAVWGKQDPLENGEIAGMKPTEKSASYDKEKKKNKMEILNNSNYLIIRVYLSVWDPGSLSVQWISRMQRKQLRGTGFFQRALTTSLIASKADGTEEFSEYREESHLFHIGAVQQCKTALPCTATSGPLRELSGVVAGSTRASDKLQDWDSRRWAESKGAASVISKDCFHAVMSLWEFSSAAACPASLGSNSQDSTG